jgi:ribosome-associated protein
MMPQMTPPMMPLNVDEMSFTAIRAQGAGGQNVNKVSSAVHLRFDIHASSLPQPVKERLLALRDQRITDEGVVVIKAQTQRSQEQNRLEAIARLQALVDSVATAPAPRKPTRPTRSSQRKRLDDKTARGEVKQLRGRVAGD